MGKQIARKKRRPRRGKASGGGQPEGDTTKNVKQTDKQKYNVDVMTSRQADQNQSMNFMLTIQSCHISMTPRIAPNPNIAMTNGRWRQFNLEKPQIWLKIL